MAFNYYILENSENIYKNLIDKLILNQFLNFINIICFPIIFIDSYICDAFYYIEYFYGGLLFSRLQ